MILYDGPSLLTGDPVVAVATGLGASRWAKSRNTKTGEMVQTWILRRDRSPIDAAADGSDAAICGDCAQRAVPGVRKRSCYVNVAWAPLNIWRKALAGGYPAYDEEAFTEHVLVRIGAYGDPAAVPDDVWRGIVARVRGWTGYTHAWPDPRFQRLRDYCMASVDSPEEAERAHALGWRTFRVRRPGDPLLQGPREVACPASEEAGHRTTCAACRICDGLARPRAPHVAINAHGPGARLVVRQRAQLPLFAAPTILTRE